MLYFVSFAKRVRRRLRIIYWVRARSVWSIERRRFRFGLWFAFWPWLWVVGGGASADEAAMSSIDSIWMNWSVSRSFAADYAAIGVPACGRDPSFGPLELLARGGLLRRRVRRPRSV